MSGPGVALSTPVPTGGPPGALRRPPGPAWNELLPLANDWRKNGLVALERIAQRYGDVAGIVFFGKRFFLLSHPDLIQHVLINKRDNYRKTRGNQHAARYFGDSMQLNNGEKARELRRVMAPVFQQSRVSRDYCEMVVARTRLAIEGWSPGHRPALTADAMELALSVAVEIHFGTRPGEETDEVAGCFRQALGGLNGFLPPEWLPSPQGARYRKAIEALDAKVYGLIRARRASGPIGPDLLSAFVSGGRENERVLNDKELRDELVSMMAAGYQTVGIAITQSLRLVGQDARVDGELAAEIRRVLGRRGAEHRDLSELSYADQVIKEALRCAPPAGMIARQVAEDDALGEWRIPAGSQVFLSCWVLHRDQRFYRDPLLFQPERWTPEFERQLPPCAYFPFGRGARACIAGALSSVILRLMLVTILQRFRLEPVDSEMSRTIKPFDRGDVPMRLLPREDAPGTREDASGKREDASDKDG